MSAASVVEDAALKKAILKAVGAKDGGAVLRSPSPDGALEAVFFDSMDASGGHGYWRYRFAVLDAKHRNVRDFGWTHEGTGNCLNAWSPDSKHLAVGMGDGVLLWRKGKFALVRLLSFGEKGDVVLENDRLRVKRFQWIKVRRGGADVGGEKTGDAEIRFDQLDWYQESQLGAVAYLLNRQPLLTPDLFL